MLNTSPFVKTVVVCPFFRAEEDPTEYHLVMQVDLRTGVLGYACSCGAPAQLINHASQFACMKPNDTSHGCVRRAFAIERWLTQDALRDQMRALLIPELPVDWSKE